MNKKPTILLVHNAYQLLGGEDTVVANEKKLLEEHGHEVIVYSRNNSELKKFTKIQKLCLPFITIFNPKTFREVKKIIKEKNIDVVHVHNTLCLISPAVFLAANRCKVPVVQTIHNFRMICANAALYRDGNVCEDCLKTGNKCALQHKCYRNSFLQTLSMLITYKIHYMFGTFSKVNFIFLTDFNKQKILQTKVNRRKNGVKEVNTFIKPNFTDYKSEIIPYEERKKQVIYVGRIEEIKGIKLLLESWDKNSEVQLIICGTGPLEEWMKQYIQDNQLKNVTYLGYTEHEKLMKIIGESKGVILPSVCYEGFPMTIVESFACATPVIGNEIGNIACIIRDGVNGILIKQEEFDKLNLALSRLNSEMSTNAFKDYRELYEKEENYKILNEIYQKIGRSIK